MDRDLVLVLVLKTLCDPSRLRIAGLLAERPRTVDELAELVGLEPRAVAKRLDFLAAARLAEARPGPRPTAWSFRVDTLQAVVRAIGDLEGATEAARAAADLAAGRDPEEAKVLRAFIVDGRLASIPSSGYARDATSVSNSARRWLTAARVLAPGQSALNDLVSCGRCSCRGRNGRSCSRRRRSARSGRSPRPGGGTAR